MRKRIAGMLAVGVTVLSAVVAATTPAAATPAPWTITPGGASSGTAGVTNLVVHDPTSGDVTLTCATSTAGVNLDAGSSADDQLGTIPETGGIEFNDCKLSGLIPFTVTQVGDWTFNGVSYNAGVTTGTIDNIETTILAAGCDATVAGSVGATYDNSTATLAVIGNPTLSVTRVDATNNCNGAIHAGDSAEFDGSYTINPAQTITG